MSSGKLPELEAIMLGCVLGDGKSLSVAALLANAESMNSKRPEADFLWIPPGRRGMMVFFVDVVIADVSFDVCAVVASVGKEVLQVLCDDI